MTDNELLLAISDIMDKKNNRILSEVSSLKQEVKRNSVILENDVLPRLQNIESCYIDTYRRYQENNENIELALEDIKLMKKVIMEHSEQLKKLA